MTIRRSALLLVLILSVGITGALPADAATLSSACGGNASGDFNGDLFDDLAIGTPGEEVSGKSNAGAVDIFYGDDLGLNAGAADPVFLTQNSTDVDGIAEAGDQFGGCVAAGDFNGDGFDDVAIGAPGETVSEDGDGVVHVIYGSDDGLDAGGTPVDQLWTQDTPKIPGVAEEDDGFGAALATGDFSGDERDDLAIGAPSEDVGTRNSAGSVNVIYGTNGGLNAKDAQQWFQDVQAVAGTSETNDRFGESISAGDLDGTGRDDLVVGIPGESVDQAIKAGAIQTILAGGRGLTASRDRVWTQDSSGVIGTAEDDDRFGAAVAAGDFDGDGFSDVAIGVPSEDLSTGPDVDEGAVHVFYGTETALVASGDQFLTSDSAIDGGAFGAALATGDADGDSADELAIGAPTEDGALATADGVVYVYEGSDPDGLDDLGASYFFDGDDAGGTAENDDRFGASLIFGNYDGSSDEDDVLEDLAIGAPLDDEIADDAGAVYVVYSDGTVNAKISLTGVMYTQEDGDDPDGAESDDLFGSSLG